MGEEIAGSEVIRMIRDLVTQKRTATLNIRTNRNRAVMFAAKDGNIVTFSCGSLHGEAAIPALQEMSSAVVRVYDNAVAYRSEQLPPAHELLAMIEAGAGPAIAPRATSQQATLSQGPDPEKVKMVLGQLLMDFMGPVAPMMCDQFLSPLGDSADANRVRATIERLAREIEDPEEAKTFTDQAQKQLQL